MWMFQHSLFQLSESGSLRQSRAVYANETADPHFINYSGVHPNYLVFKCPQRVKTDMQNIDSLRMILNKQTTPVC